VSIDGGQEGGKEGGREGGITRTHVYIPPPSSSPSLLLLLLPASRLGLARWRLHLLLGEKRHAGLEKHKGRREGGREGEKVGSKRTSSSFFPVLAASSFARFKARARQVAPASPTR